MNGEIATQALSITAWNSIAGLMAAVAVALTALSSAILWLIRTLKKTRHDALEEAKDSTKKALEAVARQEEQTALLQRLSVEVLNGGEGLRVITKRMDDRLTAHLRFSDKEVAHIDSQFKDTNERIDRLLMELSGHNGPMRRASDGDQNGKGEQE